MIRCDVQLCVGCRACEVACSTFHYGGVSPALSRIRVAKLEEIGIDMAVSCVGCIEKPCLECPTDGMFIGEKGEIVFDEDLCTACEICIEACPIGAVGNRKGYPLFCDLCGGEISCVNACPTGALSYIVDDEVSLKAYMRNEGNESERRKQYVAEQARELREEWKRGRRVDG